MKSNTAPLSRKNPTGSHKNLEAHRLQTYTASRQASAPTNKPKLSLVFSYKSLVWIALFSAIYTCKYFLIPADGLSTETRHWLQGLFILFWGYSVLAVCYLLPTWMKNGYGISWGIPRNENKPMKGLTVALRCRMTTSHGIIAQ